jgi:hypothetical protein
MSDEQHVEAAPPYASWWYAAGVSGYAWPETWQVWAARAIASSPAPAAWVIAMSKANCIADLRLALAEQMAIEHVEPNKIGDALLGYVWLRYEREELQLFDCLNWAVSMAEEHPASIKSATIYRLLMKLTYDDHKKIVIKGRNLFRQGKSQASEQWQQLNT